MAGSKAGLLVESKAVQMVEHSVVAKAGLRAVLLGLSLVVMMAEL